MRDKDAPLISVEDLKLLIYKESGYKIQISGDDPFLTMVYTNIAVLGESLKAAGRLQESAIEQINKLPGAADLEMKRAGDAAITSLSAEVGRIAQKIAQNAAEAETSKAAKDAAKLASVTILICAALFGTAGYGIGIWRNSESINAARDEVIAANAKVDAAAASVATAKEEVAAAKEETAAAEAKIDKRVATAISSAKNVAQKFYEEDGMMLATCKSELLEKSSKDGRSYCSPAMPSTWQVFLGNYKVPFWRIQ